MIREDISTRKSSLGYAEKIWKKLILFYFLFLQFGKGPVDKHITLNLICQRTVLATLLFGSKLQRTWYRVWGAVTYSTGIRYFSHAEYRVATRRHGRDVFGTPVYSKLHRGGIF